MKNPLIPGQQLYGCMIPRPEYDEQIYNYEKVMAEKKMESFKDCIGRLDSLNGLSEFERRQLAKSDAGAPMSIGYEVVPLEQCESALTDTDDSEDTKSSCCRPFSSLRSVSVKLMSDKLGYVDQREAKHLILESDGKSTYCISENSIQEEIEVVSTGWLHSSTIDNIPEDEHENEEISLSVNSKVSRTDNGLSCVFECNEDMDVICSSPSNVGLLLKHKTE